MRLTMMFKYAIAVFLVTGSLGLDAAAQQVNEKKAGDFLVRGRLIGVLPDEDSSTTIGGTIDVGNRWTGEVDFSYFVTPNIALELIAATTKHSVNANNTLAGNVSAGDVWVLPPTLTLQYHPFPALTFSPYVGAGLTYAIFYNADRGQLNSIDYKNDFGYALQIGADYSLGKNWYLNADVKKLFISTTANINGGAARADVDIDPWVVGFGVGYKF